MKQGDGSSLVGKYIVNTSFEVYDSSSGLVKFAVDAEVLDIGNREIILGLSWLTENGFSVDTQDRFLRNVSTRQLDSLNTNPGIMRSPFKTRMQRYQQGPSTRPRERKTKPSKSTGKNIF